MKSPDEYVAEVEERLAAMQKEVDELTVEANELGLPVTQYRWIPLDRRAAALLKDIARAKSIQSTSEDE